MLELCLVGHPTVHSRGDGMSDIGDAYATNVDETAHTPACLEAHQPSRCHYVSHTLPIRGRTPVFARRLPKIELVC